jgi:hypothetical protein
VLAGVVLVSAFEIFYASPNAGDVASHLPVPASAAPSVLLHRIIGAT